MSLQACRCVETSMRYDCYVIQLLCFLWLESTLTCSVQLFGSDQSRLAPRKAKQICCKLTWDGCRPDALSVEEGSVAGVCCACAGPAGSEADSGWLLASSGCSSSALPTWALQSSARHMTCESCS